MSKKKIALFIPTLDGGGAQRVALNLSEGFVAKGYDVDLILVRKEGSLIDSIPERVNVIPLNRSRTAYAIPSLAKNIRVNKYIALISFMSYVNICAIISTFLSFRKLNLIVTEHSTISRGDEESKIRKTLIRYLMKLLYPKTSNVVGVSKGAAKELKRVLNIKKEIDVIYNPIFNNKLNIQKRIKPRHPWFKEDVPIVLSVGRLVSLKNYPLLIRAIYNINQNQDCRLIILGEGKEREKLQALIENLDLNDKVLMPGFVNNVYDYMYASDLFVLPSSSEGFGNVLVEALACGVPIVSTDCPNGPSEILKNGKFGLLVPTDDEISLTSAIKSSLVKPVSTKNDRIDRSYDFSVENICSEYTHLIDNEI